MIITHLARVSYPYHPYGGLEQHVYRLTTELARLGHQVELYTQPATLDWRQGLREPVWPPLVTHHFIPYQSLPLRRNSVPDRLLNYPLFSLRLGRAVTRLKPLPDIVHAHGLAAWGYARHALLGVPLVLNPHGMEEFKVQSLGKKLAYAPFRAMLRGAAKRSAAIIATDKVLQPEVSRFLGVKNKQVKFIPNAVALDELLQIADAKAIKTALQMYKPDTHNLLLLSVGRLEANKGFDKLLLALAQLKEVLPAGWLWIGVGTGSQQEVLATLARKLELTAHIKLVGRLDDISLHALYEIADVFIHPTLYEGSSLVTLEAMAHSLPIIASATGGLPDKVRPDFNGQLVEAGNVAELAQTIGHFLTLSPAQRREMGHNSLQMVEDSFTWLAAARQTVELYQTLLDSPH